MKLVNRMLIGMIGTLVYWPMVAMAMLAIVFPCGMGPDADCDMASPLTVWLAALGFALIYVALLMRLHNWKRN